MKDSDTQTRLQPISKETLNQENFKYIGTGGVSANNRGQGFIPAFMDTETGKVYQSQYRDGLPAPVHVISGLPHDLFDQASSSNGQLAVKRTVISGFLREQIFYSRAAAALAMAS